MIKNVLRISMLALIFSSSLVFAGNYEVHDINTAPQTSLYQARKIHTIDIPQEVISKVNSSDFKGINDADEVLICFDVDKKREFVIWSKSNPLLLVYKCHYTIAKLTNNGTVLGVFEGETLPSGVLSPQKPSIWTKEKGLQKLDIDNQLPKAINTSAYGGVFPTRLIDDNALGQIIGSYTTKDGRSRAFIFENGKAKDFDIDNDVYACGYQVMNIYVKQINNRGSILGVLDYGHKHPLKNTWIKEGTLNFFWDGHILLIDLDVPFEERYKLHIEGMNNNDEILSCMLDWSSSGEFNPKTYIWRPNEGRSLLLEGYRPYSYCYSTHRAFNDHGQMLVCDAFNRTLLFDNGVFIEIEDLIKSSNIQTPQELSLNNNGAIAGRGSLWGESHVFILRPDKKSDA